MINKIYIIIGFIGLLASILLLIREGFNPISRLALLVIIFLMAALIFLILDFNFIGLTYIIVYIGAITILFLFVIMLIKTDSDKSSTFNLSKQGYIGALMIGPLLLFINYYIIYPLTFNPYTFFYPSWSFDFIYLTDLQTLGYSLFLAYPLTLFILGIILWIILIGILRIATSN